MLTACPVCESQAIGPSFFVKDGYRLVRCDDCGLAFVENPPSAKELEEFYSFASGYHVDFRDDQKEVDKRLELAERQLAALARNMEPGRCLDVGASAGFFVKTTADNGWDANRIELSADTAELARERFGVDVVSARLEDTAFEARSFDAVTR